MPDNDKNNKYTKWVLTIQRVRDIELPSELEVVNLFETVSKKYVFQKEIGDEKSNEHYQCALITKDRLRHTTLLNRLSKESTKEKSCFQLDRMHGSWEESFAYCTKISNRVGEKYYTNIKVYDGRDVAFLDIEDNRYEWQNIILDDIYDTGLQTFKEAHPRDVIWFYDIKGCSGKSSFIKWLQLRNSTEVAKLSCNTDAQLRGGIISAGERKLFVVDLPRAFDQMYQWREKLAGIISCVEDLKNGYVTSAMYGDYKCLLQAPPHVIIFSNFLPPTDYLSEDRWRCYMLNNKQLMNMTTNEIKNFHLKSFDMIDN